MLEDAERVLPGRKRLCGVQPVRVDPHELARLHVTHDVGADEVERAGLGRDDPVVPDLSECERPETQRVSERDEDALGQRSRRVRAFEPRHRVRDGLLERSRVAGDERGDDLRVGSRAEPHPVLEELGTQLLHVHEIAVVAQRDRARAAVVDQRLRIRPPVRARRRVARVPDRELSGERLELLLVEDLGDETHVANDGQPPRVRDCDPRRLLAAVLEGEETEVRKTRDVAFLRANPEDAAHG